VSAQQPIGTPAEQTEHREVPTVTEHNDRPREQRPDDCVGRPS
jgi:hypothetical protein